MHALTHALSMTGVTKRYPNGPEALRGIDLQVQEGAFFALLGPNGAGKSTTISIASSLVYPTNGQVSVCGYSLSTQREYAKCCIGLVPQEFNFNTWEKVIDILLNQAGYYGMRHRDALPMAERMLKELDLWDKRDAPSRTLSGGMKRRLMIARALVHQPPLLILDEPTAGVDIEIRRHMWQFLRELNANGTTIILTTHYLEEAESLCEDVAIIDQGKIIEQGKVATLLGQAQYETFILDTQVADGALPEIPGCAMHWHRPHQLEAEIPKGTTWHQLLHVLHRNGIEVTSMRNKSNRLEEFFLRLLQNQERQA